MKLIYVVLYHVSLNDGPTRYYKAAVFTFIYTQHW